MFDVYNGRYGNIHVQNEYEGNNQTPFVKVEANLILPKPEKCPYCRPYDFMDNREDYVYSIESLGIDKKPNTQYGVYSDKPAIYKIFSERYFCDHCRQTFFADHGIEDFIRSKHTLPEFINFMIIEWVKDKKLSFRQLAQKYLLDEDIDSEDKGRSPESLRNWCNQIVDKFDQMTTCDAADTLYFSSFHYGINDPKLYCLIGKIVDEEEPDPLKGKVIKKVSRVCTFLENYDKFDHLEETLKSCFTDLSIVERVVYDYYPGLNNAMNIAFPTPVRKIIDPKRLRRSIEGKLTGIEREYIDTLTNVFESRRRDYSLDYYLRHGTDRLIEWMDSLPYNYRYDMRNYLQPLFDTPDHFNNSYLLNYNPEYLFEDISGDCEKRSGKRERFENMKLRVLYENNDYKARIETFIEKESRRIYNEICKYCHFDSSFTVYNFVDALFDKKKYFKLYEAAKTREAKIVLDEYKNFDINDLLPESGFPNKIEWSAPYLYLVKELEYDGDE